MSGESPEAGVGCFKEGDTRNIPDSTARVFISRGVAEELKLKKGPAMTEHIRPKMHIWGPDRIQKVIFADKLEAYQAKGWRDHPNKVGLPVEPINTADKADIKTKTLPNKRKSLLPVRIVDKKNDAGKNIWDEIKKDYDVTKRTFGMRINFVTNEFNREIIFRDVEHAHFFANHGYHKPAVILAGGIIEELLRLYLIHKKVKAREDSFDSYIKACEEKGLLKSAIHSLSDFVRHFRNMVHLSKEKSPRITISKATAKGAVSAIFTISNDFDGSSSLREDKP